MLEDKYETIIDFDDEAPGIRRSLIVSAIISMLLMVALFYLVTSCTLSLQTINTSGTASDVVDDDEKADGTFAPQVSLPIKAI